MPGFRSIPDTPLEKGLEKARLEATRLDERYADLLERELEKLGRKVLPASADPLDIGVDGMIGRAMEHRGSLDKLLERMMLEAAVLGAQEGNASLNQMLAGAKAVITIGAAWDLANQTVEDWIRTQHWFSPLSLTQGLTNTERNRIRTLMVDFVTNQRPQAWLRDQIVGDTGLYGRRRAETIARTEVTHAFARGNRAAWAGRGVERVSWRTRVDELVCPICGPLHMQEFDVGSDVIPPAHARCRCWIVPAVDTDSIPELPVPEIPVPEPVVEEVVTQVAWKPTMTRAEAEEWARDSTYKLDTFHATGYESAAKIRKQGFRFENRGFGNVWGGGVYVATDEESVEYYEKKLSQYIYERLVLKVNVKNTLVFNDPGLEEWGFDTRDILEQVAKAKGGKVENLMKEYYDTFHQDLSEVLAAYGYDSLRISQFEVTDHVGGSQMVIFDPKQVVVIGE